MSIKRKNIYDTIRRNKPYFEDFITRSIYNSNRIEGNTISYAETYAITFNDNSMQVNATPRELYEAINLKYAFNYVLQHLQDPIGSTMIKKIGILLNKNISEISGFRTSQVYIRGAVHIPPPAEDVPRMIQEMLYYYHHSEENIFTRLADMHIQFERIHPFSDGNGRTGRLLLVKELLGHDYCPIVIPFEKRAKYMEYLADQNVSALASMFKKLQLDEMERMEKFQIHIPDIIPIQD